MIIHNSYPTKSFPCLAQINYKDGDIAFYRCRNYWNDLSYENNAVAVFKCKLKFKQ